MRLIVFATGREIPFDTFLTRGVPVASPHGLLLLSGMGLTGLGVVSQILNNSPEVTEVVEYGGAAAVSRATIEKFYTITACCDTNGTFLGTLPPVPGLPTAMLTGEIRLYLGVPFPWATSLSTPLLYSIETIGLFNLCRERGIPFRSIRLATDDGTGDIGVRYRQVLAEKKEEARLLLEKLS